MSGILLWAAALAVAAVLAIGVVDVGFAAVARSQASSAADAAALAGAAAGPTAARQAAERNDAELVSYDRDGEIFTAVIQQSGVCLLYTSPSPRDQRGSRMPSSA